MPRFGYPRLIGLLAALMGLQGVPARVFAAPPSDAELRAAIIYNLLLFVEWPAPEKAAPFRFCYLEEGALATALRGFQGKAVQQSTFEVNRIAGGPDELQECRAILVEAGNASALGRLSVASRTQPLLIVGEGSNAVDRGAMVGITVENGKVAFEIDHSAMQRSRLRASSRLLKLARRVIVE